MTRLQPLIAANFRASYRNRTVVLVMLGFCLFGIALLDVLVYALALRPLLASPGPDAALAARYLAMLAYGTGFIAMGMNLTIFTANILVKEKAQRIHESILAGPVTVRGLWMAKTLALFLPGLALCELMSLATLLGLDALVMAPRLGFLASPQMAFNVFALIPILFFPLYCLVILVGLAGNPVSGNVIANVAFSGILTLALNLVTRAGLDMGGPGFALGNLGLAAALGILVLGLQGRMSKERVILSGGA
jgi:hypothetical protein